MVYFDLYILYINPVYSLQGNNLRLWNLSNKRTITKSTRSIHANECAIASCYRVGGSNPNQGQDSHIKKKVSIFIIDQGMEFDNQIKCDLWQQNQPAGRNFTSTTNERTRRKLEPCTPESNCSSESGWLGQIHRTDHVGSRLNKAEPILYDLWYGITTTSRHPPLKINTPTIRGIDQPRG